MMRMMHGVMMYAGASVGVTEGNRFTERDSQRKIHRERFTQCLLLTICLAEIERDLEIIRRVADTFLTPLCVRRSLE